MLENFCARNLKNFVHFGLLLISPSETVGIPFLKCVVVPQSSRIQVETGRLEISSPIGEP